MRSDRSDEFLRQNTLPKSLQKKLIFVFMSAFLTAAALFTFSATALAEGTGVVFIDSVLIGRSEVNINVSASALPDSDDGMFYLFSKKPYQDAFTGFPITSAPIDSAVSFQIPFENDTANGYLYDKFQVAILKDGIYMPVTDARYITNPEALAINSPERMNSGKKGLILDSGKIGHGNTESTQLGVEQAAYNLNLEDVIGGDRIVSYEYNGKTYHFNSKYLIEYDHAIKTCTEQGMGVSIVLLNPLVPGGEFMISPSSRGGRALYYMMNTSEDAGLEWLEAVVSYLAYRYNGRNGFGQVDNWIIGNEVNAKNVWNYSGVDDLMAYAKLYADELRICYNAIRSKNANACVCISLDQNWTHIHNPRSYFSARATLDAINDCITAEGNIDWAVAEHPYNYPMGWTPFWTPKNETAQAMIRHDIDTPYLSMENIEQLSDYLSHPILRNTKGDVRPILLTEVGYSSTQGEEAQAAAIVYAYQRAMTNQYIDLIAFNRQTDYPSEVSQNLEVGLTRQNGTRKLAFEFYKEMNGENADTYIRAAAQIMGISDWNMAMYAR